MRLSAATRQLDGKGKTERKTAVCGQAEQQAELEQQAEVDTQVRYRLAVEEMSAAVCGNSVAEQKSESRVKNCCVRQLCS